MADRPKNKRQRAVALQYEKGSQAPRVVASGAGEIARRILELAREHEIPIQQDDTLTDILSKLDVGMEIPPETFHAVAEILAFLYRTDEAWRKHRENLGPKPAIEAPEEAEAQPLEEPKEAEQAEDS